MLLLHGRCRLRDNGAHQNERNASGEDAIIARIMGQLSVEKTA